MANYSSYESSSFSSGGGANVADAAFNQADINSDGRVDLGEFRQFLGKSFNCNVCICIDNNYYSFKDKTLVLAPVVLVLQASNHLHLKHQVLVLAVLVVVGR